jgi:membrane carboxypeptidase/penicillin-binding protein PbpC
VNSVTDRRVTDLLVGYDDAVRTVKYILWYNAYRLLSFEQYNRFDLPGTYVKSGTSRHFVDGRVCGGKADYTVCVRVGNYNAKPMRDSGYNTAGVIWNEVMKKL